MNRHAMLAMAAGGCLAIGLFVGCSKILPFFFDGVPKEGQVPPTRRVRRDLLHEIEELKRELAQARGTARAQEEIAPAEEARPPLEQVKAWPEVAEKLSKDAAGGVDWVAAINEGAIAPRRALDRIREEPQEAIADFELVPEKEPQFAVTFSHDVHLKWLKCVNCHPDPFSGRRGGAVQMTMAKIFQGEFCGRCHGTVAFDMSTGCLRCHRKLVEGGEVPPRVTDAGRVAWGKRLYEEKCAACHGVEGKGDGPKAPFLDPKPRDFTRAIFKIRSTPSGSLPTDEDLFQTITKGMPGSSMLAWERLPEAHRSALVAYLKTFSDRFRKEELKPPVEVPKPPPRTAQAVAEGKELYKDAGCIECHGERGRGDGTSAPDLTDEWRNKIRPTDFTRPETFRGGSTARDIYRTLMTGLSGTPMPAYADTLEPEQAWKLVFYVQLLAEEREPPRTVYGDVVWDREVAAAGDDVPPAILPHWFHRIRFACSVCHPAITQMKKGASGITMDGIRDGKFCGVCHTGKIAWAVSFETCNRCHLGK